MRIDFVLQANVTAVQNFTRVLVIRDFMNQGALPVASDIFQDTSSSPAVILSPYLHSLADRFEVLSDDVFVQTVASESNLVHRRMAYGINDHITFKGTSASIADTWQGNTYVITVTDQSTNGPKLILSSLITYIDN